MPIPEKVCSLAEILYRLRYVNAFALIVLSATFLRGFDLLGSVEYASLIGGSYLTLCGGGAMNTRAQAPVKGSGASPAPPAPGPGPAPTVSEP
jgi:hypothetical protein